MSPNSSPSVVHLTIVHDAGDNRIARKQCLGLIGAGFDVTLIAPHYKDSSPPSGVPVKWLPQRGRTTRTVLGSWDAWRRLRDLKPQLLHIHDPELIPLGILIRATSRTRVIYDSHEDFPSQIAQKDYIPRLMRPAAKVLATILMTAADRLLDGIVLAWPAMGGNFPHSEPVVVENYPWIKDFPPPMLDVRAGTSFVYVGGLTLERGLRTMLSAIELLNESGRESTLILAGPAPRSLKPEIEEAETKGYVRYLGRIPGDTIPSLLAKCIAGLALLTPTQHHMRLRPTKLFEYMAGGIPFIASDFPNWRELLNAEDAGIWVDPLRVDQITQEMGTLMEDPDTRARLGMNGRRIVQERFVFENELPKLVALYNTLLSTGTRPR